MNFVTAPKSWVTRLWSPDHHKFNIKQSEVIEKIAVSPLNLLQTLQQSAFNLLGPMTVNTYIIR